MLAEYANALHRSKVVSFASILITESQSHFSVQQLKCIRQGSQLFTHSCLVAHVNLKQQQQLRHLNQEKSILWFNEKCCISPSVQVHALILFRALESDEKVPGFQTRAQKNPSHGSGSWKCILMRRFGLTLSPLLP